MGGQHFTTLRPGDLVVFRVLQHNADGTYHAAVYVNGDVMFVGDAHAKPEDAIAESDAHREDFRDHVSTEEAGVN